MRSLATLPVGRAPLDPLLAQEVSARLSEALQAALHQVHALQATVGADAADLALKASAKRRLDLALRPLRLLARAWSGAVMLATQGADDEWLALARSVAATGTWPEVLTERQEAMLTAGSQALPWDLTFPEVFRREGSSDGGFDAVLSNPPWDIMQPNTAEFFAGFDLSILDTSGRQETHAVRDRLLADPLVAKAWDDYQAVFAAGKDWWTGCIIHQKVGGGSSASGGKLDLYRVFAERMVGLVGGDGAIGMVVPSAFHANEGATGIRKLFLQHTRVEQCLSFENRKSLFDIHARYKFALIIARRPGPTSEMLCGFYLTDFRELEEQNRWMKYDRDFIAASGGAYATLLELREPADLALARRMFLGQRGLGAWMHDVGIVFSREIHMSDDADRFTLLRQPLRPNPRLITPDTTREIRKSDYLELHEGKTIHQFSDRRTILPRYAISVAELADKPTSVESARYYRAACREIARSTDERTAIAAILPPGVLCGHTISVERRPARRPNAAALLAGRHHEQLRLRLVIASEGGHPCQSVHPVRVAGACIRTVC